MHIFESTRNAVFSSRLSESLMYFHLTRSLENLSSGNLYGLPCIVVGAINVRGEKGILQH